MLSRDPCGTFDLHHDGVTIPDGSATEKAASEQRADDTLVVERLACYKHAHCIEYRHHRGGPGTTGGTVDLLIGNSYGKYLERDTGTPLIRLAFPIFDRHHHHRFPTMGYQGALTVLVKLLDTIFDKLDDDTIVPGETDYSYDLTR